MYAIRSYYAPVFDDPERAAWAAAQTAIGRNGRPEDLHGVTIFLAAPASDYITGVITSYSIHYTKLYEHH